MRQLHTRTDNVIRTIMALVFCAGLGVGFVVMGIYGILNETKQHHVGR